MTIIVTCRVDQDLYHAANIKHDISLITTEYKHGNELLVHLQIGENLGIRLNSGLGDLLPNGIQNEQFLFKKTYIQGDSKLITRSTFEAKLSRFDKSQTVTEREILEKYSYIDRNGSPSRVQIVMTDRNDKVTAVIDFKDTAQLNNFVCPVWLIPLTE